jgi:hypothetical protein
MKAHARNQMMVVAQGARTAELEANNANQVAFGG